MSDHAAARDALVNRKLPEMVLSDGSAASLTAPPPTLPDSLDPKARALARFSVEGNAIITGGAGNLALAGARALLEHGLSGLALLDISTTHASDAIASLRADFPSTRIVARDCDIRSEESVQAAIAEVAALLDGSVNVLCCFAGIVSCAHALDMTAEEWRRTIEVNTTGAFFCAQAAARHMLAAPLGLPRSIVLTASISAHRVNYPQPQAAYNVSKAALLSLKSSLAAEWARYGIRVNTLSPGYMDTVLNEGEGLASARKTWAERNPWGRMGQPRELEGPLVLLCGRAGSYINGADLIVDGGGCVF